ncbi:cytosine methyltransferase [Marinomonas primoryensis]|uniref:Cytosine methyltransferase n=1 Tax=Marinomonas primoryensis TaxID=178399 RepID=A0A2Z4PXG4_9GAMM|nr:IS200/IS605 family transposase [Marinomonas primoryensis]AWY02085.1 cytosine methyltransferase [Marinomonas primoryensis]
MTKSNEYRTGRHCVFQLNCHLFFVTKYRYRVLQGYMYPTLKSLFEKVCLDFEAKLIEFNGESDHVHLLVNYPPKVSLAKLVNSLKGVSSRRLKQHHPEVANRYFKSALWSPSYFAASCGDAPLEIIKQYVEQQSTSH